MSKKIFLVFTAVLMALSFSAGRVIAAPATDISIEVENNATTVQPLKNDFIRVRLIFADSEGNLATEFGGFPINQAKLILKSLNFGAEVEFAVKTATENVSQSDFSAGGLTGAGAEISLARAWQEFAVSYYNASEIGDDTIIITLKQTDPATLLPITIVKNLAVTVVAPEANCYVVRTGGIPTNQLPDLLQAIPVPKNNDGANLVAGQSVTIDVFAGFAYDSDNNNVADVILFTNNVPAGGIKTSYGTIDTTGRILATTKAVTGVEADIDSNDLIATQLLDMAGLYQNGTQSSFKGAVIGTREIGNVSGDITSTGQLNLDANINAIPASFVNTIPANTLNDTALYRTAAVTKINLIGMAVTDWQGNLVTNGGGGSSLANLSINDLLYYSPDPTAKITDFNVSGDSNTDAVYCALYGYDKNNNPAPFYQNSSSFAGATVSFQLLVTNDDPAIPGKLNGASIAVVPGYGTYDAATGIVTTANALQSFLPLQITGGTAGGVLNLHVTRATGETNLNPTALVGIDTIGTARNFRVLQGNVVSAPTAPFSGTLDAGGQDDVTISVQGTAQENSFQMRAEVNSDGSDVDVNVTGSALAESTVNIPNTKDNKAEQDVSFYTTVENEPLRLTFVGLSKGTTFVYKTSPAAIGPADPGDYPPKSVSADFTKSILVDAEEKHDEAITSGKVTITDAFGNDYSGTYNGSTATIEDAEPTIAVFKEDGTTPFPGASAEVDKNNIIVTFDRTLIAPDAQTAKVVITAGAGSASFTINVRALQATVVDNIYQAVTKITNTPVALFFGDQNGKRISPDWRATPQTLTPAQPLQGAFEVDLEWVDGIIGLGETAILSSTKTTANPTGPGDILTFVAQPNQGKSKMTISADGRDAKAGSTTLELDFGTVDTIPPVIGSVTADNCSIKAVFTDNKALDLKASSVLVSDKDGKDITPDLGAPVIEGDGTTSGSITYPTVPNGDYALAITVKDQAGNTTKDNRPISVTGSCVQECVSVNPSFVVLTDPGSEQTLDVTITGKDTNFSNSSVVTFSCTDVTVVSANATSATEIVAKIKIAADAAEGPCDVIVKTGQLVVTCAAKFQKIKTIECTTVDPATAKQGTTTNVTITLVGIDLTGKSITKDNVNFSCTGVTVNSATVNSATEITANITVAESAPECPNGDVTIKNLSDVGIICTGKFSVPKPEELCTISIDPETVKTGFFFPRPYTITVTAADSCVFDDTTTVSFEGDAKVTIVGTPVIDKEKRTATVKIRTKPVILGGKGTNTLTVTTGAQTATATLTVTGLFF
jgi:hypothetical protein